MIPFAETPAAEQSVLVSVLLLLSVPALIAVNAFFVAAEFALVALRKTRVEEMVNKGVGGAKSVEEATDNLDRSIAASQLGITLASILLGVAGENTVARTVEPYFDELPRAWQFFTAHSLATVIAVSCVTFLHVILGEQVPKVIALQSADRVALWVSRPLNAFAYATRPVIRAMGFVSDSILRGLGYQPTVGEGAVHSVEELALLIEDTEEAGVIDEEQADIVQNVFAMSAKRVRESMIPREKMAALDVSTPPDKVLEAVRNGAHTRMPVYDGDLDNIVGVVNTKDLFYLFSLNGVVILEDAIYPAIFLDPGEELGNALRLFQRSHRHMALVRDEAGKIHGVITLEDVIEEIIGDLEDEHDRPMPRVPRSKLRRRTVPMRLSGVIPKMPPPPPPAV